MYPGHFCGRDTAVAYIIIKGDINMEKIADKYGAVCENLASAVWKHGIEMDNEPLNDDAIEHCEAKPASLKKFVVKVTTVHTLEVEAENEDEATEKACGMAWEYDADSIDGEIVKEECA